MTMMQPLTSVVVLLMACVCCTAGGGLNVSSVPCAHYEYYNASAAACVHCDELCLQTVNSDDVAIVEETCADFCPGELQDPPIL